MTQFWRNPDKMRELGITDNPEPYINKQSCFCDYEVPQSYGITNKKNVIIAPEMREVTEIAAGMRGQFDVEQIILELRNKYNISLSFSLGYLDRHRIRVYLFTNVCLGKMVCELKYAKVNNRSMFKEVFRWIGTDAKCPRLIKKSKTTKKGKEINNTKCDFHWRKEGHFKQKPQDD